ncbi:MAG: hypothetical protein ACREMQ_24375 [Longimicrobiales bacterium]
MKSVVNLVFSCTLVVFGVAVAPATPTFAAESEDCSGFAEPICRVEETKTCTTYALCPHLIGSYYVCCVEIETSSEYDYMVRWRRQYN